MYDYIDICVSPPMLPRRNNTKSLQLSISSKSVHNSLTNGNNDKINYGKHNIKCYCLQFIVSASLLSYSISNCIHIYTHSNVKYIS